VGGVQVRTGERATGEEATGETTVFIVDDRRCFAELLAATLGSVAGLRCAGTASSAVEGVERVKELAPAVVLLNLEMSEANALVLTRRLRAVSPRTRVALITGHHDGVGKTQAAQAGVSVLLPRSRSLAELLDALKATTPNRVAGLRTTRARPRTPGRPSVQRELTVRELEVIGYINEGLPTKRIAKVMGIRVQTCYSYVRDVYSKLEVCSRIAAVNRARQMHLL
jgi:DNA-binding NarL/FixJ family response regulator